MPPYFLYLKLWRKLWRIRWRMCKLRGMMIQSVAGTVLMADGTRRAACSNTYRSAVEVDGGRSMKMVDETFIEFRLFTNANAGGKRYRKASAKQAATFVADAP